MRLVSFAGADGPRLGIVEGDHVRDVTATIRDLAPAAPVAALLRRQGRMPALDPMLRLLQAGPEAMARLAAATPPADLPLETLALLAPVPRPGKIVAIGRNYADHASETGLAPAEAPRIIAKLPSAVAPPGRDVERPPSVTKLDFEVELAVVIGRVARHVDAADALAHVAGYTILNDLSAREFQFDVSPAQTTFAKSMDGFAPMGPWIITADEIADPQRLDISCTVNGVVMQQANTAQMLFPVATLIAYLSTVMTLEPGDIIATGTPAGCGAFRKPPVYLQPGDRLRLAISGIGALEHGIA